MWRVLVAAIALGCGASAAETHVAPPEPEPEAGAESPPEPEASLPSEAVPAPPPTPTEIRVQLAELVRQHEGDRDAPALRAFAAAHLPRLLAEHEAADGPSRATPLDAIAEIARAVDLEDPALRSAVARRVLDSLAAETSLDGRRQLVQALGALGDPAAIPVLLERLGSCDDLAAADLHWVDVTEALVRIGRPAVAPAIVVLRGEHADVLAAAQRCVGTVAAADAERGRTLDAATITATHAADVLGQIGDPAAIDALLVEARSSVPARRLEAAVALARVSHDPGDDRRIRDAVLGVYRRAVQDRDATARMVAQLRILEALHRRVDPALVPFFVGEAGRTVRDRNQPPEVDGTRRLLAFQAALDLADVAEARPLRGLLERMVADAAFAAERNDAQAVLAATDRCDHDLACWRGAAADADARVARKALVMLARFGRSDAESVAVVTTALEHGDPEVRQAAYHALDVISPAGHTASVATIDRLEARDGGSPAWDDVRSAANATRTRLRDRVTAAELARTAPERGRALFTEWTCVSCHALDGSPVPGADHVPRRSLANRRLTEERMQAALAAVGTRFRHPTPPAADWEPLRAFLRTLGTLR